jgi:hypothetical protein
LRQARLVRGLALDRWFRRQASGTPRVKPKLVAFPPVIDRIVEEDRLAPPKQRHTAARIDCRLSDEFGCCGGM